MDEGQRKQNKRVMKRASDFAYYMVHEGKTIDQAVVAGEICPEVREDCMAALLSLQIAATGNVAVQHVGEANRSVNFIRDLMVELEAITWMEAFSEAQDSLGKAAH